MKKRKTKNNGTSFEVDLITIGTGFDTGSETNMKIHRLLGKEDSVPFSDYCGDVVACRKALKALGVHVRPIAGHERPNPSFSGVFLLDDIVHAVTPQNSMAGMFACALLFVLESNSEVT